MGIEPTFEAWEASILPLNYTRHESAQRGRYYTGPAQIVKSTINQ